MLLKQKFSLIILLFTCGSLYAQRSANWFFGNQAGIKFTASGVTDQPQSAINTQEGCASISDPAGNLLFYTDGITVYNRTHAIMVNGTALGGHSSSSQSSIIVPMPGSNNLYYIFTASLASLGGHYAYSIVDMNMDGGLGQVVQKNGFLGAEICSERITAIQHANKKDFWILTNPAGTNLFKAYALTISGLQAVPVSSTAGRVADYSFGMLKASPDGTKIVQTVNGPLQQTQLFHFDTNSGNVSDAITIRYPGAYGCVFSPDSRRLYLNSGFPGAVVGNTGSLAQFTVHQYDSTAIGNSMYIYPVSSTVASFGDMSAGPDSVIYIARCIQKRLSAFKHPNDSALAALFTDTAVTLSGVSIFGLPNFYNNINIPDITIAIDQLSCLEYRLSFNTSYTGAGTYTWDLGDGTTSNDSVVIHTYTRTGNDSFLIKYQFVSTDGTVHIQLQQWLRLTPAPKAIFTAQTNGCAGQPVVFTNSSTFSGTPVYSWSFGDNTGSGIAIPEKKYVDTGQYLVRLSLRDMSGCLSDTLSTLVTINKKVIAKFDIKGPYCNGTNLVISDTSVAWNTIISQWGYDFDGIPITSPSPLPFTSYALPGPHTVKLVLSSAAGCVSDTVSKTVTIFQKPHAGFIMPLSCVADISQFTDTSSPSSPSIITKWRWNFNDPFATNDTSLVQNPSWQYSNAADYNVQLIVTTDKGCTDTAAKVFTVNGAVPKAALAFTENPLCGGDSIQLINNSSVNFGKLISLQVDWGTDVSTDLNPVAGKIYKYRYPLFGTPDVQTYAIHMVVKSGTSCTSTLDTIIRVRAQPQVQMQPLPPVCSNGVPVVLDYGLETMGAQGTGSYSGPGVTTNAPGNYIFNPSVITGPVAIIGYQFITPGGCTDTAMQVVPFLPKPQVNAGSDQLVLAGEAVILKGSAPGNGTKYLWTPSTWLSQTGILTPTAMPLQDITYTLTVTTVDGCTNSSSVLIRVLQPVNPPNAFSPNNDHINDKWEIANLKAYNRPLVQVFSRWGQLVFQNTGYQQPWDGTMNGKPLPTGTYYYLINTGNNSKLISGWVLLVK
jgi:gliding motility-associated-like protein